MPYRRPHNVCAHHTALARKIYELFPRISPETPRDVTIYAVDQRRGRAYCKRRQITVPVWAFTRPKGEGFVIYYLAHELAHIADYDAGNRNIQHGPVFMAAFKKLCPIEFQHFELGYKPRNARAAGIVR
jgi:hypothetical protein